MNSEEYKNFLTGLEEEVFNRCPIIGISNAKRIVSKADIEKHSYSEYEVEQYAYDLADFVENCIKEYAENCIRECMAFNAML